MLAVSCLYLQVIDVEVFFNDGVRLLLHLLLRQSGFRKRRRRSGGALTLGCRKTTRQHKLKLSPHCIHFKISLFAVQVLLPARSLLGPLSRLPRSRLPLSLLPLSRLPLSLSSVMLATRRTGSVVARLSPPLPPRSCDSLLKLLLVIWFRLLLSSRPSRPSLRSKRSKRSLSRSPLSLSPPRSRLELDLKVVSETEIHFITCFT